MKIKIKYKYVQNIYSIAMYRMSHQKTDLSEYLIYSPLWL